MKYLSIPLSGIAIIIALLLHLFGFISVAQELVISPSPYGGSQISYIKDGDEVIVAYLDKEIESNDTIPTDLKSLLIEEGKQLTTATSGGHRAQRSDFGEPIEPLIKTKWNQGAPFNQLTPEVNGFHTPAGCVAVAMAQIMNYYQYPRKFEVEPQEFRFSGVPAPYVVDWDLIPPTEFDYESMLDEYTYDSEGKPNFSSDNAQEVSKLILYCGVTMQSTYTPTGTGAHAWFSKYVFETFFNYQTPKVKTIWNYGKDNQADFTINELQNKRPVLFSLSAVGSTTGHAVVCDGYLEDNFFHFNFGWGGNMDGYYDITFLELNPHQQYFPNDLIYNIIPQNNTSMGIESIEYDLESYLYEVYSFSGTLVASSVVESEISNRLPQGIYILKSDKVTKKIVIN